MTSVTRLPGKGCLHFVGGSCLYQEHLNPGYAQEWRCRVLSHWETAYDDFLVRAEALNVNQDAVPDLWERQFERLARRAFDCDRYTYGADREAPACVHGHDGLCRLELPACNGRCRHFVMEYINESDE